ncbi:sulfotransferase family protein [archaeon]|nr:MAG: sulfotransferase family protein [archaeon]
MDSHKLEIVGASWGRNGTHSLKNALEILGYPCYHMVENIENGNSSFWIRLADGENVDFNEVFVTKNKKYTASTDVPSCTFWREQLQQYPDAKVILTVRDPERWYKSCMDTIFNMQASHPNCPWGVKVCLALGQPTPRFKEMLEKIVFQKTMKGDWSKENVIKQYLVHNEAVIRECPADKLLVFEVSEGWGPLCTFLNKPIPDQPFPHVNDTAHFQQMVRFVDGMGKAITAGAIVVPVVVAYLINHFFFKAPRY